MCAVTVQVLATIVIKKNSNDFDALTSYIVRVFLCKPFLSALYEVSLQSMSFHTNIWKIIFMESSLFSVGCIYAYKNKKKVIMLPKDFR